jgi:uncharacterized protein involved in exopolysaccharide biosynthesis
MNTETSALQSSAWTKSDGADRLSLFLETMRRNWLFSTSALVFCVAVSVAFAYLLPSYWRVEIVVMPVAKSNSVNLSSTFASAFGGLGELLGRPSSNEDEALAVLRSRELFDTYATQKKLLSILFASKWDAAGKHWAVSPDRAPTLRRAFKLFDTSIRDIDLDRRTGIVTMGITWKDRQEAAQWARDLVDLTNRQLRERAIADAQRNMNYLNGEIRQVGAYNAENALTAALAGAYERELQNYMFAKGQPEFAFRVIDAPTIPDDRERVWPQRSLFIALGFIVGGLLAVAGAYVGDYFRMQRVRVARSPAHS